MPELRWRILQSIKHHQTGFDRKIETGLLRVAIQQGDWVLSQIIFQRLFEQSLLSPSSSRINFHAVVQVSILALELLDRFGWGQSMSFLLPLLSCDRSDSLGLTMTYLALMDQRLLATSGAMGSTMSRTIKNPKVKFAEKFSHMLLRRLPCLLEYKPQTVSADNDLLALRVLKHWFAFVFLPLAKEEVLGQVMQSMVESSCAKSLCTAIATWLHQHYNARVWTIFDPLRRLSLENIEEREQVIAAMAADVDLSKIQSFSKELRDFFDNPSENSIVLQSKFKNARLAQDFIRANSKRYNGLGVLEVDCGTRKNSKPSVRLTKAASLRQAQHNRNYRNETALVKQKLTDPASDQTNLSSSSVCFSSSFPSSSSLSSSSSSFRPQYLESSRWHRYFDDCAISDPCEEPKEEFHCSRDLTSSDMDCRCTPFKPDKSLNKRGSVPASIDDNYCGEKNGRVIVVNYQPRKYSYAGDEDKTRTKRKYF